MAENQTETQKINSAKAPLTVLLVVWCARFLSLVLIIGCGALLTSERLNFESIGISICVVLWFGVLAFWITQKIKNGVASYKKRMCAYALLSGFLCGMPVVGLVLALLTIWLLYGTVSANVYFEVSSLTK